MKYKILLLICLITGLHSATQAQEFVGKLIGGLNAAQLDGDGMSGFNQPGFLFGAGAAFPLGGKWSIEPELLYSMRGSQTGARQVEAGHWYYAFRMNYIELPLMVNYFISDDVIGQFGVVPAALLSARFDDGVSGYSLETERYKPLDFGAAAGIEYRLMEGRLGLNFRLTYSAVPFNREEVPSNTPIITQTWLGAGMYHNFISASVRYMLKIDR